MRSDSRNRFRFTHNHIRYEINKDGVLRAYRRGYYHNDSERAIPVPVQTLDRDGMSKLYRAVNSWRNVQTQR
jgi:hypothetical protein